ncbi:hypothetical protein [Pseudonocardia humida]|uniref:Uncharacterized protein n=1 Tax=Pseudonocardia humida TaxID=2800819 RepID=A0ABT1A9M3_9PSEU|nr:hypothetical protein [Pseudonocardia humida]MCO1659732.1 hypothetical protein [Pseudonocardia humida]
MAVRSSAVALAQDGDPEPLAAFVARGLRDDDQNIANVDYWAYRVGEIADTQVDDRFMTEASTRPWSGALLLEHLVPRVREGSPHLALNAHTLWALILSRPRVLEEQPHLRTQVGHQVERVLDAPGLDPATKQQHRGRLRGPARPRVRQDRDRGRAGT